MVYIPDAPASLPPEMFDKMLREEMGRRGMRSVIPAEELEVEAARRGILLHSTFESFVEARSPSLLKFEHVQRTIPVIEKVVRGQIPRLMVLWPTQYMKALADDTPIPTPTGFTPIGSLQPGDTVFTADGSQTTVIAVPYKGVRPTYWVTAEDGGAVRAADNHDWEICLPQGGGRSVRTTEDLAENGVETSYFRHTRKRKVRIPVAGAIDTPAAELPIPPYTLGAWLGDGHSDGAYLTIGRQDIAGIRRHLVADGYALEPCRGRLGYRIVTPGVPKWGRDGLRSTLRRCGLLNDKHIPAEYLRASRAQRLSLLQGLIDTDGHVAPRTGRVIYSSSREALALQVQDLVHSLGAKAFFQGTRAMLDGRDAGPTWTVSFYLPGAARLPRKAKYLRKGGGSPTKAARMITFRKAEPCAVTCITVSDPSGLFLAGRNMMVTHNSTLFSKLLPAYYLLRFPNRLVALGSYGAELAWELSGEARDYYAASGGQFKEGSIKGSTRNWRTARYGGASGGMWATGVGGPALGRGYNLGIVDDPIDPEQATRPAYQKRFARWWPSKWLRGQRPGNNAIIFIMQRLGVQDPVEYLLSREEGKTAENWHILAYDEIKSEEPFGRWKGPRGFPVTCTVEPDPRKLGEILAPSWRPRHEVLKMQATAGVIVAAAQRQMRPMSPTGDFWKEKYFRTYEELPKDAYNGGWDWDTAYGEDEKNSASAGVRSFRGPGEKDSFPVYIENALWDWLEFPALVKWIQNTTGPHYVEKKATGKSLVQVLKTYGVVAGEVAVNGSKLERAAAAQPAATTGRVYVKKSLLETFLSGEVQGLLRVTAEGLMEGANGLDLNDAFVQSIHRHLGLAGGKTRKKVAFG